MCGLVLFSYLGSIPFFIMAGVNYKKAREEEIRNAE